MACELLQGLDLTVTLRATLKYRKIAAIGGGKTKTSAFEEETKTSMLENGKRE